MNPELLRSPGVDPSQRCLEPARHGGPGKPSRGGWGLRDGGRNMATWAPRVQAALNELREDQWNGCYRDRNHASQFLSVAGDHYRFDRVTVSTASILALHLPGSRGRPEPSRRGIVVLSCRSRQGSLRAPIAGESPAVRPERTSRRPPGRLPCSHGPDPDCGAGSVVPRESGDWPS